MTHDSRTSVSSHARREASEWLLLLRERESDLEIRSSFLAWIRKSPENVHAFLRMTATWEATGLLQDSTLFDREALLAEARSSSNVVGLDFGDSANAVDAPGTTIGAVSGRWRIPASIAAAVTGLLMVSAAVVWYQTQKDVYGTSLGEQRTLALQDGSTIELNSKSRLRVRLSDRQRDVDLLEGQALFRVAHNAARPFVVHSGSTSVRAVGTEFDVYRKQTGTIVTVVEGTVAVEAPAPPTISESNSAHTTNNGSPTTSSPSHRPAVAAIATDTPGSQALHKDPEAVLLSAGEQITVTGPAIASPQVADIAMATAWTQGKLVFKDTPLSEVVTQFNRSSARRLVIDATDLNDFHVTGRFAANDPERLVDLLKQRFGVSVRERDDEIHIFRP